MTTRALERRRLELELALLAAELDVAAAEAAREHRPAGTRPLTPAERRSGVRFAELDRDVVEAAGLLARTVTPVREALLDELTADLLEHADAGVDGVLARVADLADPSSGARLDAVAEARDRAVDDLREQLRRTARAGATSLVGEADRQLIRHVLGEPDLDELLARDETLDQALTAAARRLASTPIARGLTVAQRAAVDARRDAEDGYDAAGRIADAVEADSDAGTTDVARQVAHQAHGAGRTLAAEALPTPANVYASELLDRSTCRPCSHVDGRDYPSLEAALTDYPGMSGYRDCLGGPRCRGTLVVVWPSEAPPTIDDRRPPEAGPYTPPPPPPPPPPPAPRLPDDLTSLSDDELADLLRTAATEADVDTVVAELERRDAEDPPPAEAVEVPTVAAPATFAELQAADLTQLTRGQLDEVYQRNSADYFGGDPDVEEQLERLGRELDRRDALTGTRHDPPDVDPRGPEEYAAAADVDEVYLDELGLARTPALAPPKRKAAGRLRERVEREWWEYLEAEALRAEQATRGVMVRRDADREYRDKYGSGVMALLGGGMNAAQAAYYASPELRDYWRTSPRLTLAEFLVRNGVLDRKTVARAKAAEIARNEHLEASDYYDPQRAEDKRRERKREQDARRRRGIRRAGDDVR